MESTTSAMSNLVEENNSEITVADKPVDDDLALKEVLEESLPFPNTVIDSVLEKKESLDELDGDGLGSTKHVDREEDGVELLVENFQVDEGALDEDCSLAEEAGSTIKDPLSLSMLETNRPTETSWRKEPEEELSEEEFEDAEDYTTDSEEEENAREYIRMMQQRRQQMQTLKVVGRNGEVKITNIPAGIKVTRVPESKEAREKREQELARRKEQARMNELEPCALIGEKRKHGERMTLRDVRREDFEEAQDYVDFLQSKMKNISIKQCR